MAIYVSLSMRVYKWFVGFTSHWIDRHLCISIRFSNVVRFSNETKQLGMCQRMNCEQCDTKILPFPIRIGVRDDANFHFFIELCRFGIAQKFGKFQMLKI